ncbi:MAG TPA: efflux transporter outer membrane subunit [Nevskiaceae bacterium]|nr:efflux transporter outer membrane subunit [Nevskiaceae bacterium]
MVRATLTAAAAALLAACAAGPVYQAPATPTVAALPAHDGVYTAGEPVAEFWRGFNDPLLAQLVEQALAGNTDLRAALARLDQARAITRQSRFDLLPTVTAEAGYTQSRGSADQVPGVPRAQRDADLSHAALDAYWELDLFGRVRRNTEASRADTAALAADLRALQVSIAAEVARTYFELRGAQEQLQVARDNADNQRDTLKLTQARLDAGRGTEFDTQRGRAQLESTLARIPALEALVAIAAHRLAVLEGREPAALLAELQQAAPWPALPADVAVGTPADLLRRRPDVQAAERRLAAATARIGVATADLFPRLTFGGSVGVSAGSLGDMFTRDGESYSFGPGVSWAFLDLGRVRARIAAADAGAEANLALYQGAVLHALEETENALVAYAHARSEGQHLQDAASASDAAAQLARTRFEGGIADFLQVLDAERSRLEAQERLSQSRERTATALVAVYKSVAGGWPSHLPAAVARGDGP